MGTDATSIIVGVVGMAAFALLGALVAVGGPRIYALAATLNALQYRHMAYALSAAWLYAVAGAAQVVFVRPVSGERVNVAFTLLDGLVWATALWELLRLTSAAPNHVRQLGALQLPDRAQYTRLNARLAALCVSALVAGAFLPESARYVVLGCVAPLGALLAVHVYTNQEWHPRSVRAIYLWLGTVGTAALLLALLGPGYLGVMPMGAAAVAMLCTHLALYTGLLALAAVSVRAGALEGMALALDDEPTQRDGAAVHHDIDLPAAFMRE